MGNRLLNWPKLFSAIRTAKAAFVRIGHTITQRKKNEEKKIEEIGSKNV